MSANTSGPYFSASRLLMLLALVCFLLATFSVAVGTVALVPLGLCFLAASFLIP